MYWENDDLENAYDELIYDRENEEEEIEELRAAQYFDVPLPYRPQQPRGE